MDEGIVTVLVVDDEQGMRDMLYFVLGHEGFLVTTVDSGAAAVEAVRAQKFDVAVVDLRMPDLDGADTLSALKALDPDLEVVVGTGYATVETAVDCMKRGAFDFLQKPYDVRQLKVALDRALELRRLHGAVELYEASRVLLGTLDPQLLVERIGEQALKLLRVDAVGLVLSPGGAPEIHRTGARGALPSVELLGALASKAVLPGAPNMLLSTKAAEVPILSGDEQFGPAMVCPLATRQSPVGALVLLRRIQAAPFKLYELQRATLFATQITLALENARLYGEMARRVSTQGPLSSPHAAPLPSVDMVKTLVQEIDRGVEEVRAWMTSAPPEPRFQEGLQRLAERVAQLRAALP